MNPAALRAELSKLEPGATVIVNVDAFDERNLAKAGYPEGTTRSTTATSRASPSTRSR